MSRNLRSLLAALAALTLLVGACGGDDADSNAGGSNATDDGSGDQGATDGDAGGTSGECNGTSATGSTPGNDAFAGTSAVAVSLADGRAYTAYIADFEIDADAVSTFATPEIPDGGTLFTVAVTVFNAPDEDALVPVSVGEVIEYTDAFEVLTMRVLAQDGEGTHGISSEAEGTLTVTAVGDTFCGTVEYTDGQKELSGTFEAPVRS